MSSGPQWWAEQLEEKARNKKAEEGERIKAFIAHMKPHDIYELFSKLKRNLSIIDEDAPLTKTERRLLEETLNIVEKLAGKYVEKVLYK